MARDILAKVTAWFDSKSDAGSSNSWWRTRPTF